jgi:uncharacterized membrane-anchored protein
MRKPAWVLWTWLAWGVLFVAGGSAFGAEKEERSPDDVAKEFQSLPWEIGPLKGAVGSKATIAVPDKARYLAQGKTDKFFELTGNLPHPGATVIFDKDWFAVFGFADSGYIKDDEKIDADELLKSLQKSDEESNAEREKRGLPKIHTIGWAVPPHYDPQTKHLEWGVKLQPEGETRYGVNYTVRLLGRTGYESVVLVVSPDKLDAGIADLRKLLSDFAFNSGERYDEFREGDKIAEYGLGALIVGGAAAAAVKTGFWKVILAGLAATWKFIAAGVVALGATIKKIFSRKSA